MDLLPIDVVGSALSSPPGSKGDRRAIAKRSREPDLIFDTVAEECQLDPAELTDSARGSLNRAVGSLRKVHATPDLVRQRSAEHRKRWPNITLTRNSLSKHWPQLKPAATGPLRPDLREYVPDPPPQNLANGSELRAMSEKLREDLDVVS